MQTWKDYCRKLINLICAVQTGLQRPENASAWLIKLTLCRFLQLIWIAWGAAWGDPSQLKADSDSREVEVIKIANPQWGSVLTASHCLRKGHAPRTSSTGEKTLQHNMHAIKDFSFWFIFFFFQFHVHRDEFLFWLSVGAKPEDTTGRGGDLGPVFTVVSMVYIMSLFLAWWIQTGNTYCSFSYISLTNPNSITAFLKNYVAIHIFFFNPLNFRDIVES